jgi:hypothetical protein
MPIDSRQYDSARDFLDPKNFSSLIGNISNQDDKVRLMAYELYEDFYYNRPEHIRVTLRGEDDDSIEIYIPSARKSVEAINRFLAVDFEYYIDPELGTETGRQSLENALADLFKREKVLSKFNNMKRFMLVKGDALLHVVGVPYERPGKRVKVKELKPEHYFPIENGNGDIIGCHIVDIVVNKQNTPRTRRINDKKLARVQTYRKVLDQNNIPTGRVTSKLSLYQIGKWDDRVLEPKDIRLVEDIYPEFELPEQIQDLPVYHWKHRPPTGSTFGMSVLASNESIMNAINQSATDEDLTLITQGLGVYWTDASPPTDENGYETEWEIGPGNVVQVSPGGNFGRVSGVSTIAPYHEHIKLLDEQMQQGMGVPDIAIGMVDVNTAESGIALQLKLGPMLAANAETELLMVDETDEFLYDLINNFLPAYEGLNFDGAAATTQFGDPMPVNQKDELDKLMKVYTDAPSVLPIEFLYEKLNEIMGWELDYNTDFGKAIEDAKEIADAAAGSMTANEQAFDESVDEEINGATLPDDQFDGKMMSFTGV